MTRVWQLPTDRVPLTRKQYRELFLAQDGQCPNCGQRLKVKGGLEVEVQNGENEGGEAPAPARDEHLKPLWAGGSNEMTNRELWCKPCTEPKTAGETTVRAKSNAVRDKHIGAPMPKGRPMPGSKASGWKKPMGRHAHRRTE